MASRRDELYPVNGREPDADELARAQAALTEALTELSGLTQDRFFGRVDDVVTDLVSAGTSSLEGLDTVHKLRGFSAEHHRIAIELEAAARRCRLVEREINNRIDALLAGYDRGLPAPREYGAEAQLTITRRRVGLDRWLGGLFRRDRAGWRHSGEYPGSVTREPGHPPPPLPAPPVAPDPEPTAAMPSVDIAALVLGPLEVHVAGRLVPKWASLKARAVFQYLLIHQDRPTRREVLMALQWPDHSHNSARNNLNVALYSLRNTLDTPGQAMQAILYRHGCYILNPALTWWVDRNEFLSALDDARRAHRAGQPDKATACYHKAIQLYRGPLFEDDAAGEWYLPEQRRLRDLYGDALECVAEIHFQLGELPEALRFGQLAIDNDPCSEAIHRLLMRCYASQHRQQLVSRQYRVCAAALRDEIGVSPSEETTRLFRDLI
jgi:SARP family transcriptional regulator, regulator of embCAB operon